jgi:hypothetical protein
MTTEQNQDGFTRPRYFTGQMLTADDFQQEQEYHNGKRLLLNRCLFGARVACGLVVLIEIESLIVSPGLALDCAGNEIYVPGPFSGPFPDKDGLYFLHLLYTETESAPVPGLYSETEAGGSAYSRIVEGFELVWSAEDSMAKHPWENGAWKTCGETHPLTIARLVVRSGGVELDEKFAARINAGRTGWSE